jgi:kumamolisin
MIFHPQISFAEQAPNVSQLGRSGLTPPAIATAYGVPAGDGAGVKIGIVSLSGGWSAADFDRSMTDLGLDSKITSNNIQTILVDGAANDFTTNDAGSLENTLDLYCAAGVVPKAEIRIYIGRNSLFHFANVIERAIADGCDIISISWGGAETGFYEFYYRSRYEPIFQDAVSKGITVLVASGDFGSAANYYGAFAAQYPACSPGVVAVGGTNLLLYPSGAIQSETFSELSGGGVSTIFPVPAWQQGQSYTTYGAKSKTLPLIGRGVPDISAPMNAYDLYFGGTVWQVGGTSAATPVIAGIVARYISTNGSRPPQLNPVFYNNPGAFYDFASGDDASYLSEGYLSTPGWDPVVGLGRPVGAAFNSMLFPSKPQIKTADNAWTTIANTWVKTDSTTWSQIKTAWAKTVNGWQPTR